MGGKRMLHVINLDGIDRRQEITVSHAAESLLTLPRPQRSLGLFDPRTGLSCCCVRCKQQSEEDDEKVKYLFNKLSSSLATKPPTDQSTKTAQDCLRELDQLLPFSMEAKAKGKVLLAFSLGELSQRAAWQMENQSANIVQWTGLDAEAQE